MPFSGEPLEIGFNPEFLRDGLESVDTRRDRAAADQSAPPRPHPLRGRQLLVPDHADPLWPADRSEAHAPRLPLLRVARAGAGAGARARRRSRTAPARRTCSRRCTSERRVSRRGAATTRSSSASAREAARIELAGDARGPRSWRSRSPSGPATRRRRSAERRTAARGRAAARPRSRRSSSRPTGSLSSRAGRPRGGRTSTGRLAGSFPPGRACRRSTAPLSRNGMPRCGESRSARRHGTRSRPGRSALPSSARRSSRLGARRSRRSRPPFAERADELGLAGGELLYEGRAADARRRSRRGWTTISTAARPGSARTWTTSGSRAGGRDLRRFGSQGEQRLAVLSLLLAEAQLLADRGPAPPLLLLDDVLSELDERRRTALAERLAASGQTLITATGASALPVEPAQLVEVVAGEREMKPERIGDEVQRELERFGPAEGMTEIVRAWPTRDGDQIARNAWPARLCPRRHAPRRDGVVGLGVRARPARAEAARAARGSARRGQLRQALRFAPGKLPELVLGGRFAQPPEAWSRADRRRSASWPTRWPPGSRMSLCAKSLRKRPPASLARPS